MRAEALKGHLDGLLLAILLAGPMHGYAVLEALRTRSGGHLDLPSGTVYPALHRLEATGLAASGWAEVGGRRRRIYRITTAGRRALDGHRREWQEMTSVIDRVMNAPHPA